MSQVSSACRMFHVSTKNSQGEEIPPASSLFNKTVRNTVLDIEYWRIPLNKDKNSSSEHSGRVFHTLSSPEHLKMSRAMGERYGNPRQEVDKFAAKGYRNNYFILRSWLWDTGLAYWLIELNPSWLSAKMKEAAEDVLHQANRNLKMHMSLSHFMIWIDQLII